jgi:two-component system, sensor histidine kinase SagS
MFTRGNQHLSFKLATAAVVLALLVGILSAVLQIYIDLQDEEEARDAAISEILAVADLSAARAVMRLDAELAREVVGGLMEYDFVLSAGITDEMGQPLARLTRTEIPPSNTRGLTRSFTTETVSASIPLDLVSELRLQSGELQIVVDNDIYLSSFYLRALVVLVTGLAQNLVLAFMLMAAFHYMIGEPLAGVAAQLDNVDPSRPQPDAITVPTSHKRDELGHLADAANRMIASIRSLLDEQLEARRRLAIARDELEFRVEERTTELKHEIRERLRAEEQLKRSNFLLEDRVKSRTKEIREEIERHKSTLVELSRLKETADAANDAKTSFLANMSHELRTPLNAIVGFTSIMSEEMFGPLGSDKYRQYVKDIQESGTHLSEILGNILDLAKVEAGELQLNDEEVLVSDMIGACTKMMSVLAAGSDLKLEEDISPDVGKVKVDELRIKQVLINLITNALKFTQAGGLITVGAAVNSDNHVLMWVEDNGVGIPENKLETILEPFAQVDLSVKKVHQGVGLGLSLSKSLVELHEGRLWIESELDAGTKVLFTLPPERTVQT